MAESKATLWITLKDEVSSGLNRLKGGLDTLKANWLAVTAAVAATVAVLKASLNAYSENEKAVQRLNTALKNQGFLTQEYSKHLQEVAAALQRTTTFSDESIMETQTLLTTFGLAGQKLEEVTRAALDLSTGLGIDLRTATLMLGKAWAGETQTLSRYGLKIDETKSQAEKFDQVMAQVNGRFGGSAAAATATYAGKLAQLANQWDEVKESIGSLLVGPAQGFLRWVETAIVRVQGLVVAWQDFLDKREQEGLKDRVEDLKKEIFAIEASAASLSRHGGETEENTNRIKAMREELTKLNAQLDSLTKKPTLTPLPTSIMAIDPEAKAKEQQDQKDFEDKLQARLAALQGFNEARRLQEDIDMAERLASEHRFSEAQMLLDQSVAQARRTQQMSTMQSWAAALSNLTALSNAKTKEIAMVGRLASAAMAIIYGHMGAMLAMATLPPPAGMIMGKLILAAGYMNAAMIMGVPLAEGGVVMPRSGGVPAIIGEGGKSEAVIPLDDPATKEKLADVMGGGVHIHVEVNGTLIADDYSVEMFAKKIDEKLFSLRRNKESVSLR